ncbi:uncharacterized protein LOC144097913 [Amblyomma americanum]
MTVPFIPSSCLILQTPRTPKPFHGEQFEDAEDWLAHYERVATFNGWDDAAKMRNVYFSLEDAARTWFENREATFSTWPAFRSQLLGTYANSDRRENAERALTSRVQRQNEGVAMYVEDVTRLCHRADPSMSEDKKVRHLMHGVKEQLFSGLVRNPPTTLCYHCGEAGHLYRQCPYRQMGLRGFSPDSPRPRPGQRPQDIAEYVTRQRSLPHSPRRESRSPSPRRSSPSGPRYTAGRHGSSSPHREN